MSPEQPQNIATAVAEISEKASLLVREEIELAKAEIEEKGKKIAKGAVVGIVAGVFFVMALILALVGGAWLLYFYLPVGDFAYFWGFFAMAVILVVLGVIAGFIASRVLKKGAPPVPTMAIEEAQKIRDTVTTHAGPPPPVPVPVTVPASAPAPVPPPVPVAPPASPAQGAPPAAAAPPAAPPPQRAEGEGLSADSIFTKPDPEGDDS